MKTVLCYGDSLTWGYEIATLSRHRFEDRWPSVLQSKLGRDVQVIAEGLNGRTTAFDDHLAGEDRNGARILPTLLGTHCPLDVVVIMLGGNDMKSWIHGSALTAASGMKRLVQIVRGHPYYFDAPVPQVVIVSPPLVNRSNDLEDPDMFARGNEASTHLATTYKAIATELGCAFFDAASVAQPSPIDGVHLDAKNTRAIGAALAPIVEKLLRGERAS